MDARDALCDLLTVHGYAVATAASGRDAVEKLQAQPFDLVLSDVAMPGGDGFELVTSVREMGLSDVPIVLMSGHNETDQRVAGLTLGADDFVSKPLETRELLARVHAQLRRVERQAELVRDSVLDPLTHVLNRRGLTDMFDRERARLRRRGGAISVMVLDIDHFKAINDKQGHAAGDLVLQSLSRQLESFLRATDGLCRLGGDEFAVLMPDTDGEAALLLARRVRALLPLPVDLLSHVEHVRFSVGVACGTSDSELETLLARADAQMYEDKRAAHRS